ncbi:MULTISPECIES: hypothetical protein [Asticcacaulis]|uniref:hypothetical protein n=1 Tax=Asticcacaulis TaxID=76890 RepID=UPI001AEABBFD|nr:MULTISPECIES: hypothetical protein [Asticcacaulis]MBP2159672.1 hypothetical protein [Asticcacaulis solisilvae]MDR6800501.1 hypothetical protein [Asticcacaulis sp. BE141]
MFTALKRTLAATLLGSVVSLSLPLAAEAQAPSIADIIDNNLAFMKLDKTNTSIGGAFGMHFISTVNVGGTIYAYYIKYDPATSQCGNPGQPQGGIGLATSTDGVNFADQGFVLRAGAAGSWDCNFATFPGVWYDNGIFYLVYEGAGTNSPGNIGLATSSDGRNFNKNGIILSHLTSGWEQTNIGTPSLYRENGIWYLFYHGYNGPNKSVQIGLASGASLYSLTRYSGNPVITTRPGSWQAGTAGRRSIQKIGSAYYMVYEGSEAPPYDQAKWASGVARSSNLFQWTQFSQNAILPQSLGFGNDGPDLVTAGGANYTYYRAGGGTRRAMFASDTFGGFDTQWGMQSPGIGHVIGRLEADGGWSTIVTDGQDFVQYGPYTTTIPKGDNIATWKLMLDNTTNDNIPVLRLEVVDASTGGTILTQRTVTRKQFKQPFRYEYFSLPFTLDASREGHMIELRVWSLGVSYIKIKTVGIS